MNFLPLGWRRASALSSLRNPGCSGKNLSIKSAGSAALLARHGIRIFFLFPSPLPSSLSLVYFLVGIPALIAAISDLKNLEINIDVLMTVAAFVAVSQSAAALRGSSPRSLRTLPRHGRRRFQKSEKRAPQPQQSSA